MLFCFCLFFFFTHIEVSDLGVALPEPPQPGGEVLHEPAALVVANPSAPRCGEDGEDSQEGQEDKPRRHACKELVQGWDGLLSGEQSVKELQLVWINPPCGILLA